ncbi:retrovirus-related pol polyprotein from transposon TNT 1-94 [Tanacetum coccineum]
MENVNKNNVPLKGCLKVSMIRNIEGKTIGKDGKPLCPVHKVVRVLSTHDENPRLLILVEIKEMRNSEVTAGARVIIPIEAVEEVSARFTNTLYGYFIGKRLEFPLVENYVKSTWAKFGLKRVMLDDDFFLFQFETKEGMEKVIVGGPWIIHLVPLILGVWTPNTVLKKDEIKNALVWVKLHHVPIVAYSEVGLSLITTQIGRPIMLDSYTSNRQQSTRKEIEEKRKCYLFCSYYDTNCLRFMKMRKCSKEKEIDKLMALISLSFKKIYKPTNNNLRTSSNTSRANQDNSPRINRGTRYDNQRAVNDARARENVGTPVVQKSGIQCYNSIAMCKPAIFSDSLAKKDFSKSKTVTKRNVSNDFSKPVTAQILPQIMLPIVKNTNVIAPGLYKVHTKPNQTRTPQLHQDIRKPNKCVSFSTGVIPNTRLAEIILFIVDSGCSKHMTENLKLLTNFVDKFMGMVKFGNDQIAPILGYGDLVQGTITIKRVYYVEGLNHNLFSVGQFCDADLEVAFRKSTCYIRKLKGNDLLTGSRGTYLYSISLKDSTTPNPICLMSKATSSQAWLWHRRPSYLNFDTINLLSKNNIVNGLPKLKFIKDHLCSFCELGKAKRKSFHTKTTPSSKRRLQLLHMDLCGPMRVESINGKKYVLVIVDDYSRYTWTHFLRQLQQHVLLKTVSLVIHSTCENTLSYHQCHGGKRQVKFFHIFGSLCLHSQDGGKNLDKMKGKRFRDGENLDKMKEKGDACIFVGYSTQSKAYRVFNKRTRMIVESIHVNFDELPQMASDHVSSDPGPQCSSMGIEQDSLSLGPQSQENVPQVAETVTTSNELELLYSPMFSELLNGTSHVVSKSSAVHAADNPDKRQQHNTTHTSTTTDVADPPPLNIHSTHQTPTQVPTVTAPENIIQAETNTENA